MCLHFPYAYFEQLIYDYRYPTEKYRIFANGRHCGILYSTKGYHKRRGQKHILRQGLHKEVLLTLPFSRFRASVMFLLPIKGNYKLRGWYSLQYRKYYFNSWHWKSHTYVENHVSTWWAHTPTCTLSFEQQKSID